MLRSIGAVVAGYGAMVVMVMVGTIALVQLLVPGGLATMRRPRGAGVPDTPASSAYLVANIVLSFVAAVVGGWVTLRMAQGARTGSLATLCAVIAIMGVVSARTPRSGSQPAWYPIAIPIIGIIGVAASAVLVPVSSAWTGTGRFL